MDTSDPDTELILEHLVLPAVATRERVTARARSHLAGSGDGVPRPRLDRDHAEAAPFLVIPSVLAPLSAATLTLDTLLNAGLLRDERYPAAFRDYGVFPLAGAAMLLAARVIYLLRPDEREVRLQRLLALAQEDAALMIEAQEWMSSCTCSTADLSDAVDWFRTERGVAAAEPITDVSVIADASLVSAFGTRIVGFYSAFACASRGLPEVIHSLCETPVIVQSPSGEKTISLKPTQTPLLAISVLADLVSAGWRLADLEEDSDAAAA